MKQEFFLNRYRPSSPHPFSRQFSKPMIVAVKSDITFLDIKIVITSKIEKEKISKAFKVVETYPRIQNWYRAMSISEQNVMDEI